MLKTIRLMGVASVLVVGAPALALAQAGAGGGGAGGAGGGGAGRGMSCPAGAPAGTLARRTRA
ncbi:MAG: hypothetical protein JO118_05635 [Acetobacteraceae bacterium]|nr:hypothetical protein [Acetobacteraceae bacterium]